MTLVVTSMGLLGVVLAVPPTRDLSNPLLGLSCHLPLPRCEGLAHQMPSIVDQFVLQHGGVLGKNRQYGCDAG